MLTLSQIKEIARKDEFKIGIGGKKEDAIKKSIERAKKDKIGDLQAFDDPQSLVSALKCGNIDAALRGSLWAKPTLDILKSELNVARIMRIAFFAMEDERIVLLAPVGIDEGHSLEDKLKLIIHGSLLLSKFDVKAKVGVLSGGRIEDLGRHPRVSETLLDGKRLTEMAIQKDIQAEHFGILLEKAFSESNMVICPDGITGNFIFRSLHFFGGARSIGAPVVNIDRTFVDTSRAKNDYFESILLASALCNL